MGVVEFRMVKRVRRGVVFGERERGQRGQRDEQRGGDLQRHTRKRR